MLDRHFGDTILKRILATAEQKVHRSRAGLFPFSDDSALDAARICRISLGKLLIKPVKHAFLRHGRTGKSCHQAKCRNDTFEAIG